MNYSAYSIIDNGNQCLYTFFSSLEKAQFHATQNQGDVRAEAGDLQTECPNGLPENWAYVG